VREKKPPAPPPRDSDRRFDPRPAEHLPLVPRPAAPGDHDGHILRGAGACLSFLAVPDHRGHPVSSITGNFMVAFAFLSYAGTGVVTIIVEPEHWLDLPVLVG
jgi:hypothetical protein